VIDGAGVKVRVGVELAVGVADGVSVASAVGVDVSVAVAVAVAVGVWVAVGVTVTEVGDGSGDIVGATVAVGWGELVGVGSPTWITTVRFVPNGVPLWSARRQIPV
jgi:hypothetical protein